MVHVVFTEAVGVHRMGRTQAAIAGDTEQEAIYTRWVHASRDACLPCLAGACAGLNLHALLERGALQLRAAAALLAHTPAAGP